MAAAVVSVRGLATALVVMRGALIRTGIGALIVAAGEMVYQFGRLSKGAGGFGNALGLLGDVVTEVGDRFVARWSSVATSLDGVWSTIKAGWNFMLADMARAWADFMHTIAPVYNEIAEMFGSDLRIDPIMAGSVVYELEAMGRAAQETGRQLAAQAAELRALSEGPLASVEAIREALAKAAEEMERIALGGGDVPGAGGVTEAGDSGGKGSASKSDAVKPIKWDTYKSGIGEVKDATAELADEIQGTLSGSLSGAFQGLISGGKTFQGVLADIASQLAQMLANRAITGLLSAAFGAAGFGGGATLPAPGPFGGGGLYAKGGVFGRSGEITAFAKGGVVNGPTLFPYQGGIGLMGEKDAEAIMPLRKGRDGRLGVEASGGGGVVNKIINVLDPAVVGDYLATSAGERAVVNIIQRNRSALA